jgi:hypothetical protein
MATHLTATQLLPEWNDDHIDSSSDGRGNGGGADFNHRSRTSSRRTHAAGSSWNSSSNSHHLSEHELTGSGFHDHDHNRVGSSNNRRAAEAKGDSGTSQSRERWYRDSDYSDNNGSDSSSRNNRTRDIGQRDTRDHRDQRDDMNRQSVRPSRDRGVANEQNGYAESRSKFSSSRMLDNEIYDDISSSRSRQRHQQPQQSQSRSERDSRHDSNHEQHSSNQVRSSNNNLDEGSFARPTYTDFSPSPRHSGSHQQNGQQYVQTSTGRLSTRTMTTTSASFNDIYPGGRSSDDRTTAEIFKNREYLLQQSDVVATIVDCIKSLEEYVNKEGEFDPQTVAKIISARRGPFTNGLEGIRRLIEHGDQGFPKEALMLDSHAVDLVGVLKSLMKALAESFRSNKNTFLTQVKKMKETSNTGIRNTIQNMRAESAIEMGKVREECNFKWEQHATQSESTINRLTLELDDARNQLIAYKALADKAESAKSLAVESAVHELKCVLPSVLLYFRKVL